MPRIGHAVENRKHILVVDDNQDNVSLFEDFLGESGFSVSVAFNGKEGLQRIIDHRPDLILLDLYLPDMMGTDICAQLRNNPATQDIPIILCTSHQISFGEKMKGFRSGVDDYLIRPFELAELLARIHAVLRRTQLKPKVELLADLQSLLAQSKPHAPDPVQPSTPLPAPTIQKPAPPPPLDLSSTPPKSSKKRESQPLEILKRIAQLLGRPQEAFHSPRYSHDFFHAILIVLFTPMVASLAKLSAASGGFDGWIGYLSLGIVTNLIMWFATAGLLHMSLPFLGINLSMRRSLSIAGMSWAPRLLGAAFFAAYGLLALAGLAVNPDHFTSGLNMFLNVGLSPWISLLGYIGFFDVWCAFLTLTAVWIIADVKDRKWVPVTFIIGAACLLFGALTHY